MKQKQFSLKRLRKQVTAALLAGALLLTGALPVAAAVKIDETEYEGKGKIEVNFTSKVTYDDLKVTVKNAKGKKMKVSILEQDDDDLEFKILNYKKGATYKYKISGIRKRGEKKNSTVSGKIKLPSSNGTVPVREIEYDKEDREVEFEFEKKVEWNSPSVSIKSGSTEYVTRVKETDNDGIEVKVNKLKKGKTYQYTITGIRKKGAKKYTSITGTFTA